MTKTKTLTALVAAATLGIAAIAAPQSAEARWGGGWGGGAVAAGVIGGLAAGAIIGSAAAGPYYGGYYGYGPGYAGYGPGYAGYGPGYAYAPGPYYGGGCYVTRQRIWDGWNWRVRRVRVCN